MSAPAAPVAPPQDEDGPEQRLLRAMNRAREEIDEEERLAENEATPVDRF